MRTHTVENVLPYGMEEDIARFGIPLLLVSFGRCKDDGIYGFWVAGYGGMVHIGVHGLEVSLHVNFPIGEILAIEHGRGSIPARYLALGGEA